MTPENHSPRLPQPSTFKRRDHDTGFPEPFNGFSNTTLPHPDAIIGPHAVLSQADIEVNKLNNRSRRSFRHKHRRTISHGRITSQMMAMYSDAVPEEEGENELDDTAGSTAGASSTNDDRARPRSGSSAYNAQRGGLSISTSRPSTSKDGDSVFSRPENMGDMSPTTTDGGSQQSIKKRSVFRRFRFGRS